MFAKYQNSILFVSSFRPHLDFIAGLRLFG